MSVFKDKNILVVSDCVHYIHDGRLCNHNPIYTKQMSALFALFGKVTLIAPQGKLGGDFNNLSYYHNAEVLANLSFVATPNVGGNSISDKLKIVKTSYTWIKLFWKHRNNDLIYLRMPNNLNIISFVLFRVLSKKIFISYTGMWANYAGEPFTYRLQKWFISNLLNGVAFIYSPTDTAPMNGNRLIPSHSPSHNRAEIAEMQKKRANKVSDSNCIRFLSVGSVVKYKNQLRAIEIIKFLNAQEVNAHISFAGRLSDYHNELVHYINEYQLTDKVVFHGHLSATDLENLYKSHDFLIHTPLIEGYGKTIQEGFLHGLPAIVTDFPYAHYFKGDTNRVFILQDTTHSHAELLEYIMKFITSKDYRDAVFQDIDCFLNEHTIEHWLRQYQVAIQEKLIEPNVS